MTGIILLVITRIDEPDLPQLVFLLACVGLLNIYVFNIGKDVIQFLFFFCRISGDYLAYRQHHGEAIDFIVDSVF